MHCDLRRPRRSRLACSVYVISFRFIYDSSLSVLLRGVFVFQNVVCFKFLLSTLPLSFLCFTSPVKLCRYLLMCEINELLSFTPDYYTLNSLTLFWLAGSVQRIFEISARDVITADYTIIMSRTLKFTGNHVKFARFMLLSVSKEAKTWLHFFSFNV